MSRRVRTGVIALSAALVLSACDSDQTGSGTPAGSSSARTSSPSSSEPSSSEPSSSEPSSSATPSSTVPHNPTADDPTTRATPHQQVDLGALAPLAAADCSVVSDQAVYLSLMQSMATVEYLPDGTTNSVFVGNAQELVPVLTQQQAALQGVSAHADAAGYPADNAIVTSLSALESAYASLLSALSASDYRGFFPMVVTAQTALDNLVDDVGNNCAG